MKKTQIVLSTLLFVFTLQVSAQKKGFFNKLKDAATEVSNKVTNSNNNNSSASTPRALLILWKLKKTNHLPKKIKTESMSLTTLICLN